MGFKYVKIIILSSVIFFSYNILSIFENLKYINIGYINFSDFDNSLQDCLLNENQINITGEDPYIVLNDFKNYLCDFTIDYSVIDGQINSIKLYYDYGQGFSEENTSLIANNRMNRLQLNKKIENLRIDFEGDFSKYQDTKIKINGIYVNEHNYVFEEINKIMLLALELFIFCMVVYFSKNYFAMNKCSFILLVIFVRYISNYINNIYLSEFSILIKGLTMIVHFMVFIWVLMLMKGISNLED